NKSKNGLEGAGSGPSQRIPTRYTFPACASAASGASTKLRARTTASPIRPMGTSIGMAGGSLAERQDAHQHRPEIAHHFRQKPEPRWEPEGIRHLDRSNRFHVGWWRG